MLSRRLGDIGAAAAAGDHGCGEKRCSDGKQRVPSRVHDGEREPSGVSIPLRCYLVVTRSSASSAAMQLSHLSDLPILRHSVGRLTVRWRLTLLYSLLFLFCAAALLAITYKLFASYAFTPPKPGTGPGGVPLNVTSARIATAMSFQRQFGLHRLQIYPGIALAAMAGVSLVLGWVVAGRVLAPLRTITAAADRISDSNLHERLVMRGPRDELRQLADTIDRLLERLQAAFDAQRLFVANASHELRTPLAMMRTTLDVAITAPAGVTPEVSSLESDLREDLDHADQLLESFLALARAQHGAARRATSGLARADPLHSVGQPKRTDSRKAACRSHQRHCSVGERQRDTADTHGRKCDRERGAPQPRARRGRGRAQARWRARPVGRRDRWRAARTARASASSPNRSAAWVRTARTHPRGTALDYRSSPQSPAPTAAHS